MHRYDAGHPGDTFGMAKYTLIPRFLWPGKPIITSLGADFTELALHHRSSSTGIGAFGEAYWNGGWPIVVLVCVYVGLLFAVVSCVALKLIGQLEFAFLPCAWIGIKMGFRIDGWLVPTYVGAVVIYLAYFLIIWVLFLRRSQSLTNTERPPTRYARKVCQET